jgi:membrane protease YdiL (CAAX protease family)
MSIVPSDREYPDGTPPPDESPAGELPPLGVPAWAPLVAVLLVVIGGALVAALVGSVFGLADDSADNPNRIDAPDIVLNIAFDGVLIAAPIAVVMWLAARRPDPAAFGLRVPDWRPALRSMALIYGAFWVVAIVLGLVFGEPEDQSIVREIENEDSVSLLAGIAVMTCVAAPLAEEFFFRGFLFRVLWERINVSVATVVTGVLFGLVHAPDADWIGVAFLSSLGVGLCLLLWRTASLLPCIILHSFHNSISFGFTKGLPWWGFLLLIAGAVSTTYAISLLATRLGRRVVAPPAPA